MARWRVGWMSRVAGRSAAASCGLTFSIRPQLHAGTQMLTGSCQWRAPEMSARIRPGSLVELRSRLELLRSQQLTLEAASVTCPLARARLLAASSHAFLRSRRIAGLPETLPEQPTVASGVFPPGSSGSHPSQSGRSSSLAASSACRRTLRACSPHSPSSSGSDAGSRSSGSGQP